MNYKTKIYLILADASLEPIPPELWSDPLIKKHAKRRKKSPKELILDQFYHGPAIVNSSLTDKEKRGRPDIVHRVILLAQDSELNYRGFLRVYVHTVRGDLIAVDPSVKPPRNYLRFIGLMEQLFKEGRVPPEGRPLFSLIRTSLTSFLEKFRGNIIGFSRRGKKVKDLKKFLIERIKNPSPLVLIIGAFPRGFFSQEVVRNLDELIAISDRSLTTSYVVCKVLSALEELLI
ncbi:MAG: hypothetical protein ACTSX9_06150 [Candidatus Njordarchaeales archaeon]